MGGHGRRASGHGGASTVSCLLGLSNAGAELMEHHIPHPCVPVLTEPVSQLSQPPWELGEQMGSLLRINKGAQQTDGELSVTFMSPTGPSCHHQQKLGQLLTTSHPDGKSPLKEQDRELPWGCSG